MNVGDVFIGFIMFVCFPSMIGYLVYMYWRALLKILIFGVITFVCVYFTPSEYLSKAYQFYLSGWHSSVGFVMCYVILHLIALSAFIGPFLPEENKEEQEYKRQKRMSNDIHLLAESQMWENFRNGRSKNGWGGDAR